MSDHGSAVKNGRANIVESEIFLQTALTGGIVKHCAYPFSSANAAMD
jgi:hypothetical protein